MMNTVAEDIEDLRKSAEAIKRLAIALKALSIMPQHTHPDPKTRIEIESLNQLVAEIQKETSKFQKVATSAIFKLVLLPTGGIVAIIGTAIIGILAGKLF